MSVVVNLEVALRKISYRMAFFVVDNHADIDEARCHFQGGGGVGLVL